MEPPAGLEAKAEDVVAKAMVVKKVASESEARQFVQSFLFSDK